MSHVVRVTVTEGPYCGFVGEEPEHESLAAWGLVIGNEEVGATVMLTREADRLGMDCNEASWTIGWAIECFEKGVFTTRETDGIELTWGNVEGVRELLNRIAKRYGSVSIDGPTQGKDIMEKWAWMPENYYRLMGWDPKTGKPLPQTLKELGLAELIRDL